MTYTQPEDNGYAPEVFQELMTLAASFRQRMYFSAADELEAMAMRGPDRWRGVEHLSNHDVLELVADRLHRMAKGS